MVVATAGHFFFYFGLLPPQEIVGISGSLRGFRAVSVAEENGRVADLLHQDGTGDFSKLSGQGFALVLHCLKPQLDQVGPVQHLAECGQKLGGRSGFSEVDGRLELLRTTLELPQGGSGHGRDLSVLFVRDAIKIVLQT